MGTEPGSTRGGGGARRPLGGAAAGALLVLATLLAVGSCGPDRRNEALGPAGDKIDEPLSKNAREFTVGESCALPLKIKVNPADLTQVAGGLNVNGSIWGETGDYGSQKFANGNFHFVTDPNDPSRIVDITGDGAGLIPFVGAYAQYESNVVAIRATFGVRKGSELQYLDVPVPNDDHCYFLASLKAVDAGFQASGKDFDFSIASGYMVMDPSDPLVYFLGKVTRLPKFFTTNGFTSLAMGISAHGHLQSTAKAIPDKIINGHLFFGATFVFGLKARVSGDLFIRFPDYNSSSPQYVISADGSLFLGGQLVTTILSAVIPGFTSDTLHVGDGTAILTIGVEQHNDESVAEPGLRLEFAVQSANLLGSLTTLIHLDSVIHSTAVERVSGFVDTINPGFGFAAEGDVDVTVAGAGGIGLTEKVGVSSAPPSAYFQLEGGIDIVIATVKVSGDIDPLQGTFNITGSVGVDFTIFGTGVDGGVSVTIAYPQGATISLDLEICVVGICGGVGGHITIGPDPEFCVNGLGCLP